MESNIRETNYFVSRPAAASYFGDDGVNRRIEKGEIRIGVPELKEGERLVCINNARYAIVTEKVIPDSTVYSVKADHELFDAWRGVLVYAGELVDFGRGVIQNDIEMTRAEIREYERELSGREESLRHKTILLISATLAYLQKTPKNG